MKVTYKPEYGGVLFESAKGMFVYNETVPFQALLDFLESVNG